MMDRCTFMMDRFTLLLLLLYLYLTRRKLVEIKNPFSKSRLAKTGSSTNNKVADIKKTKKHVTYIINIKQKQGSSK